MKGEEGAVALLELGRIRARQIGMPLHRANPAALRQDDGDRFALDHRFKRNFARRRGFGDQRAARAQRGFRAIAVADLGQIALHPRALARVAGEQGLQLGLFLLQPVAFFFDLHFLKAPQRAQPHVEDRLGLSVGQREFGHHHRLGFILAADDGDDAVEVEIGDQIAVEQLDPVGNLREAMFRPAAQDDELMIDPCRNRLAQPHHPRGAAVIEYVQVERHPRFEVGQAEQAFDQRFGIDGARARFEHDADFGIRFIADIGQDRQLAVVDQRGDLFDQLALLHAIGDFADDDLPGAAPLILQRPFGAHAERPAPGGIGVGDGGGAVDDDAAGREIRPAHQFQDLRILGPGLVDQQDRGVDDLGGVVRRDAGRHADRDAAGAIGEQIGEQAGEQFRLILLAIIGRAEIDRILVQPVHQVDRDLRQPRFGIAIGGGVIAVDIAEISLSVDQRVTQRKGLCEADHRIIDRLVAMRMIFADHVADDARAFLVTLAGIEPQQPHRPQQPAMHRLQPVAHIGQRSRGDRRHGVDEVTFGQGRIERGIDDGVEGIGSQVVAGIAHGFAC